MLEFEEDLQEPADKRPGGKSLERRGHPWGSMDGGRKG
jgi:hypothetical protein